MADLVACVLVVPLDDVRQKRSAAAIDRVSDDVLDDCGFRLPDWIIAAVALTNNTGKRTARNNRVGVGRRPAGLIFGPSAEGNASLLVRKVGRSDSITTLDDVVNVNRVKVNIRHNVDDNTDLLWRPNIRV